MDKRLKIIYLIVFIDVVVATTLSPLLPNLVKGAEYPQLWLGLSTALFTGMQLFTAPVLGILSDQLGRRALFILSAVGTLVFNLMLLPQRAWALFINRAGDGATNGIHTAIRAAIADISDKNDLYKNMGTEGAVASVGVIVGPALTGTVLLLLNVEAGWQLPLVLGFGALLASFNVWLCWYLPETHLGAVGGRVDWGQVRQIIWENLNILHAYEKLKAKAADKPDLLRLVQMQMCLTLALGYHWYYVNYLSLGRLQFSNAEISYNFMYFGAVNVLSSFVFFRYIADRLDKKKALLALSLLGVLVLLAYAWLQTHLQAYILVTVDCWTISFMMGLLNALLAAQTSDEDRGEIFGLAQGLNSVASLCTTIIFSLLTLVSAELPFYWFAGCLLGLFYFGRKLQG